MDYNFNVVLYEPEIPQNTGNIGRLCVGTNSRLHLVEPLGFDLSEKKLRRAGLDYWPYLDLKVHSTLSPADCDGRVFFFTKKAKKSVFDIEFKQGDWFFFGAETRGLPDEIINSNEGTALKLPQYGPVRSQNLANAVSASIYLALKDIDPVVKKA